MPKVQVSELLSAALQAKGFDPAEFASYFAEWKAMGPAGEYADYYFGKDAAYGRPQRGGRPVLWHVHMPPESDPAAIADWTTRWEHGSRKTSDTSLVYTYDAQHGYLLLYLAQEPHGHSIADMSNPASAQFMNQLADVAERFIHTGGVIL